MPCFFFYNLSMKKLLSIACKQLKLLEKVEEPTWETYAQMADLIACIGYMQRSFCTEKGETTEIIADLRENVGEQRAIEIVTDAVSEFCNDLNVISPHLAKCFVNKLKEKINQ